MARKSGTFKKKNKRICSKYRLHIFTSNAPQNAKHFKTKHDGEFCLINKQIFFYHHYITTWVTAASGKIYLWDQWMHGLHYFSNRNPTRPVYNIPEWFYLVEVLHGKANLVKWFTWKLKRNFHPNKYFHGEFTSFHCSVERALVYFTLLPQSSTICETA